jgi:hypothetical protein
MEPKINFEQSQSIILRGLLDNMEDDAGTEISASAQPVISTTDLDPEL